jgi:hypothetical protein
MVRGVPGRFMRFQRSAVMGAMLLAAASLHAQGRGAAPIAGQAAADRGGRGGPPPTARAAAPIDLAGNWVAIISEDWRWRMITPAKGDYASIPINMAAKKVADTWDPSKDEGAGAQCKSYGAPGLMRAPTRLRISWQDDNTMRLETDYGMQTRLFRFPPTSSGQENHKPTLQGYSVANWEGPRPPAFDSAPGAGDAPPPAPRFGNLKVVTTHLLPGYLRKNGVPYSDKTTLTEYWDLMKDHAGAEWLVITTFVDDPTYLQTRWITSLNFKKEASGAKWDPTPCSTRW